MSHPTPPVDSVSAEKPSTREPEHYTGDKAEELGCWCNPKMEYIKESDSWLIVHNTLLPDESHKIIN